MPHKRHGKNLGLNMHKVYKILLDWAKKVGFFLAMSAVGSYIKNR